MLKMATLLEQLNLDELFTESKLEGVRYFKSSENIPRIPLIYDPGICIVAQGKKIGYLGDYKFQYDANNYLVVSITIPFEAETFGTPVEPLLGMYIDINMPVLHDLISRITTSLPFINEKQGSLPKSIGPSPLDEDMEGAVIRLIKCLQSDSESQILGPGIVREIIFRALQGVQAPTLHSLTANNSHFARIAQVVNIIHKKYNQKLDTKKLASEVNMSVSVFHRVFKEITSDSPIQYLKKIRLNRARNLIVQEGMKAYIAADAVGYESQSQFSREFKRYFGQTPSEMIRDLRVT